MEDAFYFRHGLIAPRERREIPGAPQSVVHVLNEMAVERPEADVLRDGHARLTAQQLFDASLRAAQALAEWGVAAGDRVAARLPGETEALVAFFGAMRLGAVWVPVPADLAPEEEIGLLRDADALLLLADGATHDRVQARRGALRDLRQIVIAEPGASEWVVALEREEHDAPPPADVDPFAPALLAFARDATGRLRGIAHSQHDLVLPGAVAAAGGRTPRGVRAGVCPGPTLLEPLSVLQADGCCILLDPADPAASSERARDEAVDWLAGAPPALHAALDQPVPPTGWRVPESPGPLTRPEPGEAAASGAWGTALPHVELVILDEDGRALPDGEPGAVCVRAASRGPWAGVWTPMLGYWGQPDATREALRGGLLHTAHRGRLDAEGQLCLEAPPGR